MQTLATGETHSTRGRVLVVDDSRLVRAIVSRYLNGAGYETHEADNGAAALKRLAQESYDVIITELRMPEVGGFDLLAAVKRIAPAVEVIILTGTHAQDIHCAVRALRLGAHDYLTKPPANADEVVLTVERAVDKKRLTEANLRLLRELETLSRTDALTGLPNRRSFEEALAHEVARAKRHGHALGLVLFDIDHFKKINDTYGHAGGDEVLRSLAGAIGSTLRDGDVLFRHGGEEFVVLLPHANAGGAAKVAQRIVEAVAAATVRVGSRQLRITTSAGAACLTTSDADGASLVARADAALYEAKRSGRNRAHAAGPQLTLVARQAG